MCAREKGFFYLIFSENERTTDLYSAPAAGTYISPEDERYVFGLLLTYDPLASISSITFFPSACIEKFHISGEKYFSFLHSRLA
jgi:hypothetical protein